MNEVDICNYALSLLGINNIQSLTESSKEARQCKLLYPIARNSVLESHDWDFARKRQVLALLVDTVTDWTYVYQYPTDCLKARKILNAVGSSGSIYNFETGRYAENFDPVEFECGLSGTNRAIMTEQEDAELVYTIKIEDANAFSPGFVEALALKLASDLSVPLRGKQDLQKGFMQQYLIKISEAKALDANQGHKLPKDTNSFVKSRG